MNIKGLAFALILFNAGAIQAFEAVSPGGSNYAWYTLDYVDQPAPKTGLNCRERFGIIANYHKSDVRQTVQMQMQIMRAMGQNRLRIPIFHMRDAYPEHTLLDSRGGNLNHQQTENFRTFLADIKTAGFREIMVGFFPNGQNTPLAWNSWNEEYFQENWNLIFNLRPIVVASGIQYRLDLGNEAAPASSQTQLKEYVFRMWGNYTFRFGKADTVGFSIIADTGRYDNMVDAMNRVGRGLPHLWSIHVYDPLFSGRLEQLHAHMKSKGDNRSWIIGETYYADQAVKNKLSAINLENRTVWHVYQWPITRNEGCDGHADVSPPLEYIY